ncbi:MAG: glutamate-5-semialdehyde dehydrogenase [Phycisphaerales bacterium]|nr:glutamate-5-semialdehyde dehydrogenase [Phycisphaerales bacterium]
MNADQLIMDIASRSRLAARTLAASDGGTRAAAIDAMASAIRQAEAAILTANALDLDAGAAAGLSGAMLDRLKLDSARVEAMAAALEQIAAQDDPIGATISSYTRDDGLVIEQRRVGIGVIGIIFESRPNVTADAAGLCLKSGNACILRGGKEALHSNLAIAAAVRTGVVAAGLPEDCVTMIETTDREMVGAMARAEGGIDVIIPRGGEGLIRAVAAAATIPVIKHYNGICHVYIHAAADADMAREIILNAKAQRPGVCNAAETLLVDAARAELLPELATALGEAGVTLRCCEKTLAVLSAAGISGDTIQPATAEDWATEYLNLTLSVKLVDDLAAAVEHIATYASGHTEAIVTADADAANAFVTAVDSASVMVNASTRFADGGEYGLGAEIGISTDKLHARGPVGALGLTTYKWVVTGTGHVRG